jgi:hypothetical protein
MNQKELDRIISREALCAIKRILGESEQEKQAETTKKVMSLKSEADEDKSDDKKPQAVNPQQTAKELVDVTLDKVVDKLNMMRSGKSANDKEVKSNLDEYFKSLTMGERQSLYVFLDALNQIMTAGVEGKSAPEPEEQGIDTEPTRLSKKGRVKAKDQDSIIVVGESQDTSDIKRALLEMQE